VAGGGHYPVCGEGPLLPQLPTQMPVQSEAAKAVGESVFIIMLKLVRAYLSIFLYLNVSIEVFNLVSHGWSMAS
jgi:hypothetical protein